jgi:putative ABC transport system permease protein
VNDQDKVKPFGQFVFRYAFRNLWRNSRRTILTLLTVIFATSIAIVANRYSAAIMKLWQDGAADTGSAHAQVHAKGYWTKQEGVSEKFTIKENSKFENKVRIDKDVEITVRRLELEGIISTLDDKSAYFVGKGVEPSNEMKVSPRLFTDNDEGSFVQDDDRIAVAIGKGLAKNLDLKIGDEATLISQTLKGSVNGIDVKVVGIVDAAIPSFSKRVVYVHIKHLQRLIRMPGRYTELAIRLKPETDIHKWVDDNGLFAEAESMKVRGWWDIEPVIKNVGKIWDSVVLVITALLFLSTALSVLNIIYMMVAERTVEIGTLMALGAKPIDVRILFCIESALIGLIGGGGGLIIGNLLVFMMGYFGVPFESPFGAGELIINPNTSLVVSVIVFTLAVLICCFSALMPARKASLVEPVKAFRGQIT